MRKKTQLSILAAVLLLAGCHKDDGNNPDTNRTPLAITAGSEALHPSSRAVDATWHTNDAIGVYTLTTGTTFLYDNQFNLKYMNAADEKGTATFSPADDANTAYYPADGSEVDVIAYYPYSAANSQLSTFNSQLTIDVSDQSSLPAIDFMTSAMAVGHSASKPKVSLVFRHRLSKLVTVIKTDESTAHIDPASAAITLHNTATKGTYDLLNQAIVTLMDIADIRLSGRTAIVMPTIAGSDVGFTVEAGGKEFSAQLPESVALEVGKVTTVTIVLKEQQTGQTTAAVSATIADWEGGPTTEVDAVRFTSPTNPETGVPAVPRFHLWKNADETGAAYYEYNNGSWSATPAFFLVEDVKDTDVFNARFTPADDAADAITGIKDILEAGPAAMSAEGIVALEFRHINALLAINLSKGEGIATEIDLATAQIEILNHHFTGAATGNRIFAPATLKAGSIIAQITLNGQTYEAKAEKDFVLAAGTRNTLSVTLSVSIQGKRTAAMNVTTKDWVVGADESVNAIRFIAPTNPTTGEPSIKKFTVMKNGAEPTVYEYNNGEWSATPAFFLVEDTKDTDEFTATVVGEADAISGLADELAAGPARMNSEGVVDLEFSHTLAKLNILLYADFINTPVVPDNTQVTYQGITYTGADKTFIINPATFKTGDVIATVVMDGQTYEAKATKAISFAAGTTNKLSISLKIEEQGKRTAAMNVTTKDWTVGTDETADAIRFTQVTNPTTGEPSIKKFTVMKNGAEPTLYEYSNGEWSATPAFFLVDDTNATDEFTATAQGETDAISGVTDELTAGPATMSKDGIINLQFSHVKATLTVRLYKSDNVTGNLADAKVTYEGVSYTGAEKTFMIHPKSFAKDAVIATVEIGGFTYEAKATKATSFAAGTQNTLNINLDVETQGKPTAGLQVTTKDWAAGNNATANATRVVIAVGPGDGSTEVSQFTLYKNKGAANQVAVTYKLVGTAYEPQNGAAPFYIEDVVSTDRFTGQVILSADAVTGLNDVIETPAVAMSTQGVIDLAFSHTNAKLTLALAKGSGFAANTDLSTAVVKLLSYTQTVTGASNSFIMEPKTYATGTQIATVTVAGQEYAAKLNAAMTLEAGKHTALTVTLSPTATGITVNVVGWTEGAPAAGTAINILTPGHSNNSTLNTFDLWLNSNYNDRRTYTYANNVWSVGSSQQPFYAEQIGSTDRFYARYTPAAVAGQAPDIVATGAVAMANNQLALNFAHIMSILTLEIKPGTGLTAADLAGATLTLSLKDYAGIDAANAVTPSATATAKTIAPGSYIYVPQAHTNLPVTVTVGDRTYTGTVNLDLTPGNKSTLTLTINPTGVGAEVNVTDWGTGGSTGGDLELQ